MTVDDVITYLAMALLVLGAVVPVASVVASWTSTQADDRVVRAIKLAVQVLALNLDKVKELRDAHRPGVSGSDDVGVQPPRPWPRGVPSDRPPADYVADDIHRGPGGH